jgi:tetratricopeptide (TPR) repeat protein
MGVVWVAQQIEPVKRTVAVKLIKPGMDSRTVLARFEAERQALAVMDHLNIAKVLDAGTTGQDADPTGGPVGVRRDERPFFVMELVKGVPITQFCDERKLTPHQRLELFVPVCQAVQHAHQKGIIHRDIKPSNVLVALYDDRPVPKVIDFGVAKATGQPLTEHTLHTDFGAVIGTPQYMSPEQATFNNLDVDTRTDVYSLGVLLYELLAGSPPFTKKDLERAGVLEMLRVVREDEPPRPSTKLSTADALPTLAANRGTEPKKLTGLLRNELDWVVMKALEKDRSRRYDTANGFAADVLRYLAGEPVLAHPPSAGYRLRKFVRRHRGAVLAASAVLLALFGAIGAAVYGAVAAADRRTATALQLRAEGERDLEAEKAKTAELLKQQAESATATAELRKQQAERERDAEARTKAEQAKQGIDRSMALATDLWRQFQFGPADAALAQAEELARKGAPERLAEVGRARRDLAFVVTLDGIRYRKWVWIAPYGGKGQFDVSGAAASYRAAFTEWGLDLLAHAPSAAAERIASSPIKAELIAAVDDWALCAEFRRESDRLLEVARRADPGAWTDRCRSTAVWSDRAALAKLAQEADAAEAPPAVVNTLVELMRRHKLPADPVLRRARLRHPKNFDLAFRQGMWYQQLPWAERENRVRAVVSYEAALAIRPNHYAALNNLGLVLAHEVHDLDGAIAVFRRTIEIEPKFMVAHASLGLALAEKASGAWPKMDDRVNDEALVVLGRALELAPRHAQSHFYRSQALLNRGQLDDALAAIKRALESDPDSAEVRSQLGRILLLQKKVNESLAACERAIELDPNLPTAHAHKGDALYQKGDLDGAITAYQRGLAIDPKLAPLHYNLGLRLFNKGKVDEAILEYRFALALVEHRIAFDGPRVLAHAHDSLGTALMAQKKLDDAIASFRRSIEADPKYAPAYNNLGLALKAKGNPNDAIASFRRSIEADPQHAPAHFNLGVALFEMGKPDDAIRSLERAIELVPTRAISHNQLGIVFRAKGKQDEAIAAFKRAVELDNKFAYAYANLGHALALKGDRAGAREALSAAARLDKSYVPLMMRYAPPLDVAPPPHEKK